MKKLFANIKWKTAHKRVTPLERLDAHLMEDDDAGFYADRLEVLGKVMFGELWKPKKAEDTREV